MRLTCFYLNLMIPRVMYSLTVVKQRLKSRYERTPQETHNFGRTYVSLMNTVGLTNINTYTSNTTLPLVKHTTLHSGAHQEISNIVEATTQNTKCDN